MDRLFFNSIVLDISGSSYFRWRFFCVFF